MTPPNGGGNGGGATVVASLSDLRGLDTSTLKHREAVCVQGYYAPNDGGGGDFSYDGNIQQATDDGGSVIVPSDNRGAHLRIPGPKPRAEWFGAKGDGAIRASVSGFNDNPVTGSDDGRAIHTCILVYGECHLFQKTYAIANELYFKTAQTPLKMARLIGENKRNSKLAFLGGNLAPAGGWQDSMVYIQTGTELLEIRNLTMYANQYNRKDVNGAIKTIQCVRSHAWQTYLTDLICWGFGRAGSAQSPNTAECFALSVGSNVGGNPDMFRESVVVQRVDFSQGTAYNPTAGDNEYPEITFIMVSERNNVVIADNTFRNLIRVSGATAPRNQFISFHGSRGVRITGNTFENTVGNCLYVDNLHTKDVVIQGNTVRNSSGTFINFLNSHAPGSFENVSISANVVHMKHPAGSLGNAAFGVLMRAELGKNAGVYKNINIHDNVFILKDAGSRWEPGGIYFQTYNSTTRRPLDGDAYQQVYVHDNSFDVPSFRKPASNDCLIPRLNHPASFFGCPKNLFSTGMATEDARAHVIAWGNVTRDGLRVTPWGFAINPGFVIPTLTPANTEIGYATDQRESGYEGIEQSRLWNQASNMHTVSVGSFTNCFYLFGKGPNDPTFPGPDGRITRFYFGMANKDRWTVILPTPEFDKGDNVGDLQLCSAAHVLEMGFWRRGHVIKVVGLVENTPSKGYAEIAEFVVPDDKALIITARANRMDKTGRAFWDVQ